MQTITASFRALKLAIAEIFGGAGVWGKGDKVSFVLSATSCRALQRSVELSVPN